MKINFSSALALGVTAAAEYIDMDVTGRRFFRVYYGAFEPRSTARS